MTWKSAATQRLIEARSIGRTWEWASRSIIWCKSRTTWGLARILSWLPRPASPGALFWERELSSVGKWASPTTASWRMDRLWELRPESRPGKQFVAAKPCGELQQGPSSASKNNMAGSHVCPSWRNASLNWKKRSDRDGWQTAGRRSFVFYSLSSFWRHASSQRVLRKSEQSFAHP